MIFYGNLDTYKMYTFTVHLQLVLSKLFFTFKPPLGDHRRGFLRCMSSASDIASNRRASLTSSRRKPQVRVLPNPFRSPSSELPFPPFGALRPWSRSLPRRHHLMSARTSNYPPNLLPSHFSRPTFSRHAISSFTSPLDDFF